MRMLKGNFLLALGLAIQALTHEEDKYSDKIFKETGRKLDFKSGLRQGLEDVLNAASKGEQITIGE